MKISELNWGRFFNENFQVLLFWGAAFASCAILGGLKAVGVALIPFALIHVIK